jgi:ABC-type protease/lipase transport system fused ATPase/permease subunit
MTDQQEELKVDEHAAAQLSEAARWARLVGIFGMVISVLLLVFGIFSGSILQSMGQYSNLPAGMSPSLLTGVYIILGAFFLLLSFYIFRFGQRMKVALAFGRQDYFNHAFLNLKFFFRILGFIVILNILSYFFSFLGALFGR